MLQKNSELTIPHNNPFQNDQLERGDLADNLTLLIQSTTQPFAISIQSPAGCGKTTTDELKQELDINDRVYK